MKSAQRIEQARLMALAAAELLIRSARALEASKETLSTAFTIAEKAGEVRSLGTELWLLPELKAWARDPKRGPAPVSENDPLRLEAGKVADLVTGLLRAARPGLRSFSAAGRSIRRSSKKGAL